MRKWAIAAMALCAVAFVCDAGARKTYTLAEIEAMKKSGQLTGNETFIIIEDETVGLTGGQTESATLTRSGRRQSATASTSAERREAQQMEEAQIIAYDKVSPSRFLIAMAREYYGNGDFWPYIYEENSYRLGHPDRIRPGSQVKIPSLTKYGVNPKNPADVEKARKLGKEIYARYE